MDMFYVPHSRHTSPPLRSPVILRRVSGRSLDAGGAGDLVLSCLHTLQAKAGHERHFDSGPAGGQQSLKGAGLGGLRPGMMLQSHIYPFKRRSWDDRPMSSESSRTPGRQGGGEAAALAGGLKQVQRSPDIFVLGWWISVRPVVDFWVGGVLIGGFAGAR